MSDFVNRPGMGTLFPNSYKDTDSKPDYKGSLTLESGEVVKFAAWSKEGAKGPYLSLKIDKPRPDADAFRAASTAPVAASDRDDPFASDPFSDPIPF